MKPSTLRSGGPLVLVAWLILTGSVGCTRPLPQPDLGARYDRSAMHQGPDRNPVIVIPGILGSKLHHPPPTPASGALLRAGRPIPDPPRALGSSPCRCGAACPSRS